MGRRNRLRPRELSGRRGLLPCATSVAAQVRHEADVGAGGAVQAAGDAFRLRTHGEASIIAAPDASMPCASAMSVHALRCV